MIQSAGWHLRLSALILTSFVLAGCAKNEPRRAALAQTQVERLAQELDQKTDKAGVYVRVDEKDVRETDPWNTLLMVNYSQGGVAEVITVRSAGPDRRYFTEDDLVAERMSANFNGVVNNIKNSVEETATKAAKGFVKGTVEGAKEAVKDALEKRKKETN
ncbi:hypothetical protein ETAA8_50090 [Anatilimnocola aggregata]|uniref:Lipoprotein n=1 Tax=Anatilimnocola aggregata TaxID=2528021 RepID=A0A517YI32_9BACT|nr:hypothetical protein [Anatilimnocola aggregata]QDU29893.1 hypothetical protein ETAA8_50090 [Anatilimnocola aggregata]